MSSQTAHYRITEDDYVRVGRLHGRAGVGARVTIVGVVALCVGVALYGSSATTRGVGLAGAISTVASVWFVHRVLSPWHMRRHYRAYKAIREELTVVLTTDGVRFSSIAGDSLVGWDSIHHWRRGDDYVLIYLMPRLFHAVPRRVVEQGFDVAALEAALERHVGPAK